MSGERRRSYCCGQESAQFSRILVLGRQLHTEADSTCCNSQQENLRTFLWWTVANDGGHGRSNQSAYEGWSLKSTRPLFLQARTQLASHFAVVDTVKMVKTFCAGTRCKFKKKPNRFCTILSVDPAADRKQIWIVRYADDGSTESNVKSQQLLRLADNDGLAVQ